jgi:hypothetical protein
MNTTLTRPDIFDLLLDRAAEILALQEAGQLASARNLRDDTINRVEAWLDGDDYEAREIERMEQLAAQRESLHRTAIQREADLPF